MNPGTPVTGRERGGPQAPSLSWLCVEKLDQPSSSLRRLITLNPTPTASRTAATPTSTSV